MTRSIIFMLAALMSVFACGDNANGEDTPYGNAFAAKYPTAQNVEWEDGDDGYHEAEFTMNNVEYEANFDADGNWIETHNESNYNELPEVVKRTIQEQYEMEDVKEVDMVESATKGNFYHVEMRDDLKSWTLEVDSNGKIMSVVD